MLTASQTRTHIGDHDRATVASEAAFQDLGQFATSKGCVLLLQIDGTNTLFESEQALVDLSAIDSCLLISLDSVCPSLTTRQIDEGHGAIGLIVVTIVQSDGQYGV